MYVKTIRKWVGTYGNAEEGEKFDTSILPHFSMHDWEYVLSKEGYFVEITEEEFLGNQIKESYALY